MERKIASRTNIEYGYRNPFEPDPTADLAIARVDKKLYKSSNTKSARFNPSPKPPDPNSLNLRIATLGRLQLERAERRLQIKTLRERMSVLKGLEGTTDELNLMRSEWSVLIEQQTASKRNFLSLNQPRGSNRLR